MAVRNYQHRDRVADGFSNFRALCDPSLPPRNLSGKGRLKISIVRSRLGANYCSSGGYYAILLLRVQVRPCRHVDTKYMYVLVLCLRVHLVARTTSLFGECLQFSVPAILYIHRITNMKALVSSKRRWADNFMETLGPALPPGVGCVKTPRTPLVEWRDMSNCSPLSCSPVPILDSGQDVNTPMSSVYTLILAGSRYRGQDTRHKKQEPWANRGSPNHSLMQAVLNIYCTCTVLRTSTPCRVGTVQSQSVTSVQSTNQWADSDAVERLVLP